MTKAAKLRREARQKHGIEWGKWRAWVVREAARLQEALRRD